MALAALCLAGPAQAAPSALDAQNLALLIVPPHVLDDNEVMARLKSPDGRPVMLVLYASWCEPCRQEMPMIVDQVRQHQLDFVKPVFISLDPLPGKLSSYLMDTQYFKVFAPYVVKKEESGRQLTDLMALTGSRYDGHIPYIAFYRDGKVVTDQLGIVDKDSLLRMAAEVKQ